MTTGQGNNACGKQAGCVALHCTLVDPFLLKGASFTWSLGNNKTLSNLELREEVR